MSSRTDPTAPATSRLARSPALEARNLAKSFGAFQALQRRRPHDRRGRGRRAARRERLRQVDAGQDPVRLSRARAGRRAAAERRRRAAAGGRSAGRARWASAFVYQDLGLAPRSARRREPVRRAPRDRAASALRRPSTGAPSARAPVRSSSATGSSSTRAHRWDGCARRPRRCWRSCARPKSCASTGEQHEQSGGVLVLDEPTVFLPEHEKVFLFDLVRRVTDEGFGVLFVSHDISAVREIAHRAVVLRDGEKVGDVIVEHVSDADLIELVSGHRMDRAAIERATTHGRQTPSRRRRRRGALGQGRARRPRPRHDLRPARRRDPRDRGTARRRQRGPALRAVRRRRRVERRGHDRRLERRRLRSRSEQGRSSSAWRSCPPTASSRASSPTCRSR